MEPMQPGVMKEKPRSSDESILNKESGVYIAFHSIIIAACVMIAFMIGKSCTDSAATASTMAFATLCLARLFEGFDSRGKYSLAKLGIGTNLFSLGAFFLGAAFLTCALMIAPVHGFMNVSDAFTAKNLLQVAGLAVIPFAVTQVLRMVREAVTKAE
jgi:Ca2+-transporting ATPase